MMEVFYKRKDAFEEPGLNQDFHFKLKNNGYLMFKDIDLGSGTDSFKIAVSCENSKTKNANVEFRLGSPTGKLMARLKSVLPTGLHIIKHLH